ncbi:MAG: hypothetical protein ACOYNY_36595, partial [Caldilineaceae bacterium]
MVTPQNKTKIFRQNNSLSQPVRQIALIVVLTLIGYSLAPPDLTTGAYVAQIHTTIAGQTISLDFPFAIGAATGAQVTKSVTVNGITLMIMGNEQYRLGIGERLRFQARAVDGAGQPVPLTLD